MNIQSVKNNQNFQGLNFKNVCNNDRIFVKKDFKDLKYLGERYDIKLTSTYADIPGFSAIDIDVTPLKNTLSFWERLFPPVGRSTFKKSNDIGKQQNISIVDSVHEAIDNLTKKYL